MVRYIARPKIIPSSRKRCAPGASPPSRPPIRRAASAVSSAAGAASEPAVTPAHLERPFASAGAAGGSRVVVPAPQYETAPPAHANGPVHVAPERSAVGRAGTWFGILLVVLGAA